MQDRRGAPSNFEEWLTRIEAEYREMPDLCLTQLQMQRFWGLDGDSCARLVAVLVSRGVLREAWGHTYAFAGALRHPP